MSPESYCRDIEAYLCRKNDGHLIRIAGPAFERVIRWAEQGIPFKVACAGIDRYFERYYRRGPRRRPVRIEFCEADVLDAFDDWRRAVGVADRQSTEQPPPSKARPSLASHIERSIARLTALRASSQRTRPFEPVLERIACELDGLQPRARMARGAVRESVLDELSALDRELIAAALAALDASASDQARDEAQAQLEPFRGRMTPDAYQRATRSAVERYAKEYFGLPTLSFP